MALTRWQKMLRSDGALSVTFVNTGSPKRPGFETYADLLGWGVATGALSAAARLRLEAAAARHPAAAAAVVRKAAALRRRLERAFFALSEGRPVAASDFEPIRAELRRVLSARDLVSADGDFRWSWGEIDGEDLDRMLWPVVYSAGNLLASGARERIRRCGAGCGLWFLAGGPGRPRKWCSVACRNRASSKSHYHRKIKPQRQARRRAAETARKARLSGFDKAWKRDKK